MLRTSGYRPELSSIAICITSQISGTDSSAEIIARSEIDSSVFKPTLADGRHRLQSFKNLSAEEGAAGERWTTFYNSYLTVALYASKDRTSIISTLLECIKVGTALNEMSGSVLRSSVRDFVHTAISIAHTIKDRMPDLEWPDITPARLPKSPLPICTGPDKTTAMQQSPPVQHHKKSRKGHFTTQPILRAGNSESYTCTRFCSKCKTPRLHSPSPAS